jgi:hypothetical protein
MMHMAIATTEQIVKNIDSIFYLRFSVYVGIVPEWGGYCKTCVILFDDALHQPPIRSRFACAAR